jgi:hypothetical protein
MRIDSSGNVGIGTSSPSQKFHVEDTTASNTSTYIQVVSGNAGNAGIAFGDSDADLRGGLLYNNADDALRFFKSGFTEAMRIDSSGNVGIGRTSGGPRLEVGVPASATRQEAFNATNGSNADFKVGIKTGETLIGPSTSTPLIFTNSNNTERMRIDSSGRVGIGTSSPQRTLHVNSGLENTAAEFESNDGSAYIAFSDNSTTNFIYQGAEGNNFVFGNGSEAMRIDSSGNLDLTNGGGNIIMANGAGIDFSASEGGGASSSILDDYEEGTWTPDVTSGTVTYNQATYTRVGNLVTVRANISSFSDRTTASGITFTGLPFSAASNNRAVGACMARYFNAGDWPTIYMPNTGSNYYVYNCTVGNNWLLLQHNHLNSSNSAMYFTFSYITA